MIEQLKIIREIERDECINSVNCAVPGVVEEKTEIRGLSCADHDHYTITKILVAPFDQ